MHSKDFFLINKCISRVKKKSSLILKHLVTLGRSGLIMLTISCVSEPSVSVMLKTPEGASGRTQLWCQPYPQARAHLPTLISLSHWLAALERGEPGINTIHFYDHHSLSSCLIQHHTIWHSFVYLEFIYSGLSMPQSIKMMPKDKAGLEGFKGL